MQDLAPAVSTLSQFGFGIVQLCLVSNRETWRRHMTGSFQPVSALEQCSGLSSESRDTDLWRRHSGTMTEAQVFASLAVMLSVNHMLLLLFYLSRRSCVQGCLDTHYSSRDGWFCTITGQVICYWSQWKHIMLSIAGSMSVQSMQKHGRILLLWSRFKRLQPEKKRLNVIILGCSGLHTNGIFLCRPLHLWPREFIFLCGFAGNTSMCRRLLFFIRLFMCVQHGGAFQIQQVQYHSQ